MSCEKCYEMLRLARAELQAECFIIENQDLWWLQCDRTSPRHHVFLQKPSIKSLESSWIQIRLWMRPMFGVFSRFDLPSGKLSHNYGKPPFFMGKSTISMAMFNSYVSLPEGTYVTHVRLERRRRLEAKKNAACPPFRPATDLPRSGRHGSQPVSFPERFLKFFLSDLMSFSLFKIFKTQRQFEIIFKIIW